MCIAAVFEIKGARGARCAHFHCRVPDFQARALGVRKFVNLLSLLYRRRVHSEDARHTVLKPLHPWGSGVGAPNGALW